MENESLNPPETINNVFKNNKKQLLRKYTYKYKDKVFLISKSNNNITYDEFYTKCRLYFIIKLFRFARSLYGIGLKPKDNINICCKNDQDYLIALCGILISGCCATGI